MTAHQGFRVSSSTSGTPSPGYEHLSGGYRYRKDPDWKPGDPRYRDDDDAPARTVLRGEILARQQARQKRIAAFAAARAEGLSVVQAAERVGVRPATGYEYENERAALETAIPEAGHD